MRVAANKDVAIHFSLNRSKSLDVAPRNNLVTMDYADSCISYLHNFLHRQIRKFVEVASYDVNLRLSHS